MTEPTELALQLNPDGLHDTGGTWPLNKRCSTIQSSREAAGPQMRSHTGRDTRCTQGDLSKSMNRGNMILRSYRPRRSLRLPPVSPTFLSRTRSWFSSNTRRAGELTTLLDCLHQGRRSQLLPECIESILPWCPESGSIFHTTHVHLGDPALTSPLLSSSPAVSTGSLALISPSPKSNHGTFFSHTPPHATFSRGTL